MSGDVEHKVKGIKSNDSFKFSVTLPCFQFSTINELHYSKIPQTIRPEKIKN